MLMLSRSNIAAIQAEGQVMSTPDESQQLPHLVILQLIVSRLEHHALGLLSPIYAEYNRTRPTNEFPPLSVTSIDSGSPPKAST